MSFPAYVVHREEQRAGVESLEDADLPEGDVLIEVAWSSVNYKDAMATQPGNKVARTDPLVPGVDLAGVVLDGGPEGPPAGTPVLVHGYGLGVAQHGGFAGRARVPAGWVVPLPEGLSPRAAMAVGTAGFTAMLSLRRLEQVGLAPGAGPVLVTGATGGVGSTAVALLASAGYEVVASSGKAAEHDYLRRLGAAEIISREDLAGAEGRVLGPERWAGAVDCVGGTTLAAVLRSLRYGAAVAASGLTAGTELATTVFPFIIRGVSLLGVDSVETPMETRRAVWEDVARRMPLDRVDDAVDREVGLEGLAPVLESILAAQVRGRVLVRPEA
jgi:acrylyl-CoA reductase (NADPH)